MSTEFQKKIGTGALGGLAHDTKNTELVLLEDWLKKKYVWRNVGQSRGSADRLSDINWQIRYFRLFANRLVYYRDNNTKSEPLGEILLQDLVVRQNDENTISIYPQRGAIRLYPDLDETCVERCYLRRCLDPKMQKENKASIYGLDVWFSILRQHSYPRNGADLVIHIGTNQTIIWGTAETETVTHEEVAFLEAWRDDPEFIQFAFELYGEGHDITTFSSWLRQPRNVPALVKYAEEYCNGNVQRQERMKRILREVGEDKSVYSFWRLLDWIRSGQCGLRVLVVFRTYDRVSIPAMFDRCAEHGFGTEIARSEDGSPLVWTTVHKVDEGWAKISPDDCSEGFLQPGSIGIGKGGGGETAINMRFEEVARKQFDGKKHFRPHVCTTPPSRITLEMNGRVVSGYDRFDELDMSKMYNIEQQPALFRSIFFPEGSYLRIAAIQDNYKVWSRHNWRNGKPICAGPYVRPHQVVFHDKIFQREAPEQGSTMWAIYDLFGNFVDGTRSQLMHTYSAEKEFRNNEDQEDRELINVPLFFPTILHSKTTYDSSASDPMYFIGRIVELIPSISEDLPVSFRRPYSVDMPPIRFVNEIQRYWALPVVWDPRRQRLDWQCDSGIFVKAVQWNILADILAFGRLQLFEHFRPYPSNLFDEARGCLDKKNKWMPIEMQSKLFNARYSQDNAQNVPKYWTLREPVGLIPPTLREEMLLRDEECRLRFEQSVLGWEHRLSLFIDNLLEQKATIIYLQEVDRYCDFKKGLGKSDLNPNDYRGFHISNCNSRTKYMSIRNLLEAKLIINAEDTLISVLLASLERCTTFPDEEKRKKLLALLGKDRMRTELLVELLFKDFSKELTLLDIWPDIHTAIWKIPPEPGEIHGSRPYFVEDGLAIFIDPNVFEVDHAALERLRFHMHLREIYEDEECRYYKNCSGYDRSVESGKLYIDPNQLCVYFYYSSTQRAGVIVVPVVMKNDKNCHTILFSTHLQSGWNDAAERTRQNQVTEFSVQMEALCTLMDRPVPMLGGVDANTDPRFRECLEWSWNPALQRYVEKSSGITAAVNTFELLIQHGFEATLPDFGVTVLKERDMFSTEPAAASMPSLALLDYVLVKNRANNPDCKHEIISHSVSINTTINHMLPNVIEPSDHKGVVSWLEIRPKLYKKNRT
eukprot:GEMP01004533.1.p1 GENE.GEMP01004533.1~~GEMP01004533.1.p1  ORF type:complete len:1155 (+),score=196.21 GEMP01004533.1:184-3648(+)